MSEDLAEDLRVHALHFRRRWFCLSSDEEEHHLQEFPRQSFWFAARKPALREFFVELCVRHASVLGRLVLSGRSAADFVLSPLSLLRVAVFLDQMVRNLESVASQQGPERVLDLVFGGEVLVEERMSLAELKGRVDAVAFGLAHSVLSGSSQSEHVGSETNSLCAFAAILLHKKPQSPGFRCREVAAWELCFFSLVFRHSKTEMGLSLALDVLLAAIDDEDVDSYVANPQEGSDTLKVDQEQCVWTEIEAVVERRIGGRNVEDDNSRLSILLGFVQKTVEVARSLSCEAFIDRALGPDTVTEFAFEPHKSLPDQNFLDRVCLEWQRVVSEKDPGFAPLFPLSARSRAELKLHPLVLALRQSLVEHKILLGSSDSGLVISLSPLLKKFAPLLHSSCGLDFPSNLCLLLQLLSLLEQVAGRQFEARFRGEV